MQVSETITMKTRCPNCQTVFRVTPEQLKARLGKVRCGKCQDVFDALKHLLEDEASPTIAAPATTKESPPPLEALPPAIVPMPSIAEPSLPPAANDAEHPASNEQASQQPSDLSADASTVVLLAPLSIEPRDESDTEPGIEPDPDSGTETAKDRLPPLSDQEAQELGKATGLIAARETTDIPGYSKWTAGVMAAPVTTPADTPTRGPFVLAASLLSLLLIGQLAFHFRADIAARAPFSRPAFETLSLAFGTTLPLPRHADRITIEASDLQNDTGNAQRLVLNATLRNRADYAQDYPSLELALTDTQDATIARRVFMPQEYLHGNEAGESAFGANSDLAIRLWIETKEIVPAGYRLYVFYP